MDEFLSKHYNTLIDVDRNLFLDFYNEQGGYMFWEKLFDHYMIDDEFDIDSLSTALVEDGYRVHLFLDDTPFNELHQGIIFDTMKDKFHFMLVFGQWFEE